MPLPGSRPDPLGCWPRVVFLLLFKAISSRSTKPYQTEFSHVADYIASEADKRRLGLPSLTVTR